MAEEQLAAPKNLSLFHEPIEGILTLLMRDELETERVAIVVGFRLAWLFWLEDALDRLPAGASGLDAARAEVAHAQQDIRIEWVLHTDRHEAGAARQKAVRAATSDLLGALRGARPAERIVAIDDDPRSADSIATALCELVSKNDGVDVLFADAAEPIGPLAKIYAFGLSSLLASRRAMRELPGTTPKQRAVIDAVAPIIEERIRALDAAFRARALSERAEFERVGMHPTGDTATELLGLFDPAFGEPARGYNTFDQHYRNALAYLRSEEVTASHAEQILGEAIAYTLTLQTAVVTPPAPPGSPLRRIEDRATTLLGHCLVRLLDVFVRRRSAELEETAQSLENLTRELGDAIGGEPAPAVPAPSVTEQAPGAVPAFVLRRALEEIRDHERPHGAVAGTVGRMVGSLAEYRSRLQSLPAERLSDGRRRWLELARVAVESAIHEITGAWATRALERQLRDGRHWSQRDAYRTLGLGEGHDQAKRGKRRNAR